MTMSPASQPTKSPSRTRRSLSCCMYSARIHPSGAAALRHCKSMNCCMTGLGAAPYDPASTRVSLGVQRGLVRRTVVDVCPSFFERPELLAERGTKLGEPPYVPVYGC